jgi:hypothetical protein
MLALIDDMPAATSAELDDAFRTKYEDLSTEKWNKRVDENTLWLESQFKHALEKRAATVPTKPSSFLGWALDAQQRGFYVLPCDPGGKEPAGEAVPHGVLDASNDPNIIRGWWAKNPNYNPAISLGPSNLVVYDYDTIAPFPNKPATLRIQSGRALKDGEVGGIHDYYRGSCKTRSMWLDAEGNLLDKDNRGADGVVVNVHQKDAAGKYIHAPVGEIRSRGAYVIYAGALHKSGNLYKIINDISLTESPEQNTDEFIESGPAVGTDKQNEIANFVETAFTESGVDYRFRKHYQREGNGFVWYIACPWKEEHTGGKDFNTSSAVIMYPSGMLIYECKHAHCDGVREWKELRAWMEEKAGHKLTFSEPTCTVLIDNRPAGGAPAPKQSLPPATVMEVVAPNTVAEAAAAAAAITTAALVKAEGWDGDPEDVIPPFDPSAIKGIYREFVELVTRGTTLVPQFAYAIAKTVVGAKMAGNVKFTMLDVEPRYYTSLIGETGSGKGEAWRRSLQILCPQVAPEDEDTRQIFARNSSCGLKIINSFDSGAGLKDAFFESPENRSILCYVDEVGSLGNKGKETKNPEIIDAVIELADSTSISRVLAKRPGGAGGGTKTKNDARLCLVMCGQDGSTYMKAFAGRTKLGLWDRLYPEFGVAQDAGDLPPMNIDGINNLFMKLISLEYSGTMSMSLDAKEMIDVFWAHQLPEVRKKARWKKNLMLDAHVLAFGRGVKGVQLEDARDAIKTFSRQMVIRKICFTTEVPDRTGYYLGLIKNITASMQRKIDAGLDPVTVAKSRRDYEKETHAHRDNETHLFERAWQVHYPHWLKKVKIKKTNGQEYEKFLPLPEDN